MKPLINIDIFINIFKQEKYRQKLDKIILNFFGLEASSKIDENEKNKELIYLEFLVFIDKQFIFKIIVKDTKNIFKTSKSFFINFSFKKHKRNYLLVYPCYWEIYCNSCLTSKNKTKSIENLAAFLAATNKEEIKKSLAKIKEFSEYEVKEIICKIDNQKTIFSKDK